MTPSHPVLGGASTWWRGTPLRCTKGLPHPCPLRGTRPECRPGPKPTLLHWPQSNHFFWLRGDTCRHASPSFSPYSPATLKLTLASWHITTYDVLGSANTHTSHRDGDVYAAIPHTTRLFPHSLRLLLPLSLFLLPSLLPFLLPSLLTCTGLGELPRTSVTSVPWLRVPSPTSYYTARHYNYTGLHTTYTHWTNCGRTLRTVLPSWGTLRSFRSTHTPHSVPGGK